VAGMFGREEVMSALRRVNWAKLGVEWVVLFGSLAYRGVGEDVDLLVKPRGRGGAEWRLRISIEVRDVLGVDWARVDVVEASNDTPCPIIHGAWRHGILVYEEERGRARRWLLPRVMVCSDYELAIKRLHVIETGVMAARRRWGPGSPS